MFSLASLSLILLLVTRSIGMEILSPSADIIWTSAGPNELVWLNQTGDFAYFNIQLAQDGVSAFNVTAALNANGILTTRVPTSVLSYNYTPSCLPAGRDVGTRLPTGDGFTLRLIPADQNGSEVIEALAISQPFSIVENDATYCTATSSSSVSSPAAIPTSSATPSGSIALTSSPSHIKEIIGGAIGGVLAVLIIGGVAWWVRKTRRETRQRTVEFGMMMSHRISISTQPTLFPTDLKKEVA